MSINQNLFDFHRTREMFITNDHRKLILEYEFSSFKTSEKFGLVVNKEYSYSASNLELKIKFLDTRKLSATFSLPSENLDFLYKVAILMAFIVGDNVTLTFYSKEFEFAPIVHFFNAGIGTHQREKLLTNFFADPVKEMGILLCLLEDKETIFAKILPDIIKVNAFGFVDIRFIVEFGILERLAQNEKVSGVLFANKSTEYNLLKEFSKKINNLIDEEYPEISLPEIKNKINLSKLNEKGVSRIKIESFLGKNPRLLNHYKEYISEFSQLRNQIIVHGTSNAGLEQLRTKRHIPERMHDLMLELVFIDYDLSKKQTTL